MSNRYIIGRGELLVYNISPPPIRPNKSHPYDLGQAIEAVVPQIELAVAAMERLPDAACPNDIAVAQIDLHPTYISKSYFPKGLLREAGLSAIGSRTVRVTPRKVTLKTAPIECETTRLFVAGKRESFAGFPDLARGLTEGTPEAIQFAEIEHFGAMTAGDRLHSGRPNSDKIFEVGLHLLPEGGSAETRRAFTTYARECGFTVYKDLIFPVGRMLFLAVRGSPSRLERLALFTLMRVLRPMPLLRSSRPFPRSQSIEIGFSMPNGQPLSNEPRVAVLDGGLPDRHPLEQYIGKYEESDATAVAVQDYVDHGLGVTSAFLFGPIKPGAQAMRPYAPVDHFRVLDEKTDDENALELYRTLGHIEEILLSRQYQFINLSLGPDLPVEDGDVHAWTAVLDTTLADGETILTVAVGNNGARDHDAALDRIQVPSDSVNAISVGATDYSTKDWDRADYSARGPGRSPGRRKPDLVAFGGSPLEYFHVAVSGTRPRLSATMGTSFAAPYLLRTAVGVRAVLGEQVHPLTIKALLVHAAERNSDHHPDDIGWGRVPDDLNTIISCGDGVARIIYQGILRPGKLLRAPVPLPPIQLQGKVRLSATFCYASPVDVEDAAAYTKAGLTIRFRPHSDKKKSKHGDAGSKSFFSQGEYRTERELRGDLGKWETVLHAHASMYGRSLKEACFDIHYNARDGGGSAGANADLIRYALVLTLEAPRHHDIYEKILASHARLRALESRVSLPLRT